MTTVNPQTWQLVKTLVEACLNLPPSERARYLADSCAEPEVCAEVMSLLESYEESDRFLDDPRGIVADVAAVVRADASDNRQIGPYKLIAEIGHGGMGTVYRAFRDDDVFQIVVALKVVSRGMDSETVRRRFRTERQILASLDHPYIARILDGGTTATGLPYFVMEYVDGRPLTRYCDEHKLSVPERLALFRKVCEAVAYAHQNLVLHRDLKPTNILVTADGTPKLLDFGIAKLTSGSQYDEEITSTILPVGTPAYASPEQISGGLTGVATDVYSLGVMLHELLTGRRPGTFGREHGRKRLSSDLDNILDMALRKESQRRYGSVEQLSEDIRRHLEGMPVLARKDTWWYRSGKFVKRHRVGLAATILVGVALCASTTMAFMKAQQLSNRVSQDQKLASLFLVDVHDAIARLPGSTPAREVLLSQSLKYLNELAPEASDDIAMRKSLALAYERFADLQSGAVTGGLGQASAAFRTYRRAQEIREELAAAHPNDRPIQLQMAESYLLAGVIAGRAGGADKRVDYDRKALAILERLNAQDPANRTYRAALARAHTGIAYSLSHDDLWLESRQHLHKALDLRKTLSEEAANDNRARRSLALIYYRLGVNYAQSRQPNEAIQYLDNALALQSALAQQDRQNRQLRFDIASTQHFLAVCLNMMNRHADALPHLKAAITQRESMLAEDSRDARTRSLLAGNYAEQSTALLRLNKPQAAVLAAQRAVDLQNVVVSLDPQGVPVRISAADFYARAGAANAALAGRPGAGSADHLVQAIAMYERAVGFYDRLQEQGHLRSRNSIEDAENARREAQRLNNGIQRLKSSGIRAAVDE